jgi:hypothetical protein
MGECASCGRNMKLQARGLCRTCYRHQRFIENPVYAANHRAQEREAKRQRRLNDQEWAEKERARDRARTRTYSGNCELCGDPGVVAKGLCQRCYGRTWMQARRAANPAAGEAEVARNAKRIMENSAAIRAAKQSPCADCGGQFPPECMDFDHIAERGPKLFNLSKSGTRVLQAVLDEIAKCDVICANCHRIRSRARAKARGRNGMC